MTRKQTNKHSQPSPAETAERRDIIGHQVDVSLGMSSFSPNTFLVWPMGEEIFPKNLGHAHKTNEYMDAMASIITVYNI